MTPRVFISYSHDSEEHKQWVLELATTLRQRGVDAVLDRYADPPPKGWPHWMRQQLMEADFVLLICTATYCQRFLANGEPPQGKGVTWEGQIIQQLLYTGGGDNTRFIPVVRDPALIARIPPPLGNTTVYVLPADDDELYRRLTRQNQVEFPALGRIVDSPPPLPPLAPRSQGAPDPLPETPHRPRTGAVWRAALRRYWKPLALAGLLLVFTTLLAHAGWLRLSREEIALGVPTSLERCLQEGRRRSLPYVLESVTLFWSFQDEPREHPVRRKLTIRTVYVTRALRPHDPKHPIPFREHYGYDKTKARFTHWYGPEKEVFQSVEGRLYDVLFTTSRGDVRTVVTGAQVEYTLPLPPNRPGFGERVLLTPNQEFWRYPNESDVICELTLIVYSDTTRIFPVGSGAARARGPQMFSHDAVLRAPPGAEPVQTSLSARWDDVILPGEDLGIHFTW